MTEGPCPTLPRPRPDPTPRTYRLRVRVGTEREGWICTPPYTSSRRRTVVCSSSRTTSRGGTRSCRPDTRPSSTSYTHPALTVETGRGPRTSDPGVLWACRVYRASYDPTTLGRLGGKEGSQNSLTLSSNQVWTQPGLECRSKTRYK